MNLAINYATQILLYGRLYSEERQKIPRQWTVGYRTIISRTRE